MRTTHTVSNKQINVGTLSTLSLCLTLHGREHHCNQKFHNIGLERSASCSWVQTVLWISLPPPSFRFHLLLLFFLPHWLRFFSGRTGGQTETGGTVKVLADLYDKRQYLKFMEANKNNSEILLR